MPHVSASLCSCVLKLCLQPLLVWLLAALVFHLPPLWSQVVTVLAALPTAANAYLFAQRYRVGIGTAAAVAVVSTAASCVTLTIVLLLVQ
ncbi:MAG: hypothetical protein FJZ47_08695 [Candidatus Tectomicrobia bacterium]|uniref:AEC family transporter n=1 Tax=Tectimicrobiota bacterium TaxID=2528274 RepID=A0A937VZ79_UNCTE|nr:hypothetical protein [Candidatus Tectomicrobia bacterium]